MWSKKQDTRKSSWVCLLPMYHGAPVAIRRHLDCSSCSFLIASGTPLYGTRVVHHRTDELQQGWIFLAFYGIRSVIIVFTRDRHLSLTWARLTQPKTSYTTPLRFMFISPFYINLAIPSCHHSSCSPEKAQYKFLFHHICHITCLANLPSFDHPNNTWWQAMSRSSSIRDLQQSPITATPQLTTSPFTANQSYDQNVRKKIFPATYFTTRDSSFIFLWKKKCSYFFATEKPLIRIPSTGWWVYKLTSFRIFDLRPDHLFRTYHVRRWGIPVLAFIIFINTPQSTYIFPLIGKPKSHTHVQQGAKLFPWKYISIYSFL
jgi:hypothetical protein